MYYAAMYLPDTKNLRIFDTLKNRDDNSITMPEGFMSLMYNGDLTPEELSKRRDDIEDCIITANLRGVANLSEIKLKDVSEYYFQEWRKTGLGKLGDVGFLNVNDLKIEFIGCTITETTSYELDSYMDESNATVVSSAKSFNDILEAVKAIEEKISNPDYKVTGKDKMVEVILKEAEGALEE